MKAIRRINNHPGTTFKKGLKNTDFLTFLDDFIDCRGQTRKDLEITRKPQLALEPQSVIFTLVTKYLQLS